MKEEEAVEEEEGERMKETFTNEMLVNENMSDIKFYA